MTHRPSQTWSRLFIERITTNQPHKGTQAKNPKTRERGGEGLPDNRTPSALGQRPGWAWQTLSYRTSPQAQVSGEASVEAGVEQEGGALPRVRSAPGAKNNRHSHHSCLAPLLCDSWNWAVPKNVTPRSKERLSQDKENLFLPYRLPVNTADPWTMWGLGRWPPRTVNDPRITRLPENLTTNSLLFIEA